MSETIRTLISREDVEKRVRELGEQISADYKGREIVLVCILKGAAFFACELAKNLDGGVRMEFMRCSSYGSGDVTSGKVKLLLDLDTDIEGRDVIVVEDIIDTGLTMKYLLELLSHRKPASLALAVLLDKPDRRRAEVKADYTGFSIPDEFVVGYGLDYDERYRQLPYIGVVEKS